MYEWWDMLKIALILQKQRICEILFEETEGRDKRDISSLRKDERLIGCIRLLFSFPKTQQHCQFLKLDKLQDTRAIIFNNDERNHSMLFKFIT